VKHFSFKEVKNVIFIQILYVWFETQNERFDINKQLSFFNEIVCRVKRVFDRFLIIVQWMFILFIIFWTNWSMVFDFHLYLKIYLFQYSYRFYFNFLEYLALSLCRYPFTIYKLSLYKKLWIFIDKYSTVLIYTRKMTYINIFVDIITQKRLLFNKGCFWWLLLIY